MERTYIAIDLKSFYASVECVDRGYDPLGTNLVVADDSRTEKTICLAVSPSLKAYGIPGRPRLFEVMQAVERINNGRLSKAPGKKFTGSSRVDKELKKNPGLKLDYCIAPPRMALYMKYSTDIYQIYLKYIAPEDMHVYSCDEVFMDVTAYLNTYRMTPHELALKMIREVLAQTGITATAGIGPNLFLCKIAMDIAAKHMPADKDGVRIAELDEYRYRRDFWTHRPLTDFWRVGAGTARRLESLGLYTMGDVARYSEIGEDRLYKAFGVNAELLIDHAWGWEPCTIEEIKRYKPEENSLSIGQVLQRPYCFEEAKIIVREMADGLSLNLLSKNLVSDQIVLTVGYEHITDPKIAESYEGEVTRDRYERLIPKHAHGSHNLSRRTAVASMFIDAALEIFERCVDPRLMVRRMYVVANHVEPEGKNPDNEEKYEQLDLFTDYEERDKARIEETERLEKEKALQLAELKIKSKFGKNAIVKGTSLQESATGMERNRQIGGHKA
ncbi:MAG: DNA methylase [Lachnospiraceae bacterium]|nr:DNA methylase [Lachnospiraceae bacterium]